MDLLNVSGSGGTGALTFTICLDCQNKAKKECSFRRCRRCCMGRRYDCVTHIKSTWLPAEQARLRLLSSTSMEVAGSSGSTSHTFTSNVTPPTKETAVVVQNEGSAQSPNPTGSLERGTFIGSPIDVEAQCVLSFPTTKGKRSKFQIRRAWNPVVFLSSSFERNIKDNGIPSYKEKTKDDLEWNRFGRKLSIGSSSHLYSDVMEAEHSVVFGLPKTNVQCQKEQHVVLPTEQVGQPLFGTEVEGLDNQTANVTKRKRGRPKGSGNKSKSGSSKSRALGMSFRSKGPENDSTFHEETDSPFVNGNGGTEDETANSDLTFAQIEEHQNIFLHHRAFNPPINGGIEDEASNTCPTIDEIDRTQLLTPTVKEHQTHVEKSNRTVEDNEDNHRLMSNEAESSFSLEATCDVRALHSSIDVATTTCTCSSLEKESFPFTKSSPMWGIIESMEAFQLMPQHPHFRPLKKANEELREGIGMGHMLTFANLVERTSKAHLDDPRSVLENRLKGLADMEEHGFIVQPIRSRLEEMLKMKDSYSQLDVKLNTAEKELIDENCQFEEIQESITQLNMQLQTLLKAEGLKLVELQRTADEIEKSIQRARLDFDGVVAAPL